MNAPKPRPSSAQATVELEAGRVEPVPSGCNQIPLTSSWYLTSFFPAVRTAFSLVGCAGRFWRTPGSHRAESGREPNLSRRRFLEVAVRNGRWVLTHVPAGPRPAPPSAKHNFPTEE